MEIDKGVETEKVRAPNFSLAEKSTLFNIALKYKQIIEDKKTDRTSLTAKVEAWEKITSEFNASSPATIYRSTAVLKKAYDNKKKEVRKIVAEERRQLMKTGGGPPAKVKKDDCFDLVLSIVNDKTVYGLESNYDSDAVEPVLAEENDEQIFEIISADTDEKIQEALQSQCKDFKVDETTKVITLKKNIEAVKEAKELDSSTDTLINTTPNTRKRRNISVTPSETRRRSTTTIRALSSSVIAEKYDLLMDKRLKIADLQMAELKKNLVKADEEIILLKLKQEEVKQQIELNKTKNKLILT